MRELLVKLQNLLRRGKVSSPGADPVFTANGVAVPGAEHREPQGLHFALPAAAQGVVVAPNADPAAAMALCFQGAVPSDSVAAGEGGLHYLGAFKVFLSADGKVALGAKLPADFVALASLVDARLTAIQTAFDAHTHVYSPGPSPPAPTAPPASPIGSLASVASTQVKCS